MFEKVLIANRGEIAVRIIQTCRRLGIGSVAVYSEIDARSLHVRQADEAVFLGPPRSDQSYLVKEKLIEAALNTGCQAVHPGYGFLSENPGFADLVASAGLAFVGPKAAVIATLGDKIASKELAMAAGVPVVPGHNQALGEIDEVLALAGGVGFPLLLKPAAGGGGKGMRVVFSAEELPGALRACQEETRKAFADNRIFIERYLASPRHVEIQIIADHHGNVVHLGERECSVQRRHQKIIEETPSPAVDAVLRRRMGDMAVSLVRKVGYTNAGTVEFLLDPAGDFFFLEMNTRLQVEHPVTEMVTNLDLVELQLRVAAGEPLPISQEDLRPQGWAMEARINAEDPGRGFLPSTGIITRYAKPRGRHIRLDSGIEAGSQVGVFYDSMLAKVIAWGQDRPEAIQQLVQALNRYHIEGVVTNMDFVNAILNHPAFARGELSTGFVEEHFEDGQMKLEPAQDKLHIMAIAATLIYHARQNLVRDSLKPMAAKLGQAHEQKEPPRYMVKNEKWVYGLRLSQQDQTRAWLIWVGDRAYQVLTPELEFFRRRLKLTIDGQDHYLRLQYRENSIITAYCGIVSQFDIYSPKEWELAHFMPQSKAEANLDELCSPMPGLVVEVRVKPGDRVYRGQDLVIIESMKMECGVSSPRDGEVDQVKASQGQAVETDDVLLTFKEA
ncbi:MAG: acetyl-CoA carboxylase biotin carboxylase subunit [Desulfarculus sp.]|nr:acetyl-CoA carboxylase biotin carboxylase subunit [Desulfarculus sp.]